METKRFYIESNGIWDKYRDNKKLTWLELCNTLNALDCIADKNLDEYEHIVKLEDEIERLHKVINEYELLVTHVKGMVENMEKRIGKDE